MTWINPETKLPEQRQKVLYKTRVLHTSKIRAAVFQDNTFIDLDVPRASHDADSVWGWQPFDDSDERE